MYALNWDRIDNLWTVVLQLQLVDVVGSGHVPTDEKVQIPCIYLHWGVGEPSTVLVIKTFMPTGIFNRYDWLEKVEHNIIG